MIPESIPVFLNGRAVHVAGGTTLGQLVAQEEPGLAAAFASGNARANDARGLPVAGDTVLVAGAIIRLFQSARSPGATDA